MDASVSQVNVKVEKAGNLIAKAAAAFAARIGISEEELVNSVLPLAEKLSNATQNVFSSETRPYKSEPAAASTAGAKHKSPEEVKLHPEIDPAAYEPAIELATSWVKAVFTLAPKNIKLAIREYVNEQRNLEPEGVPQHA